MGSVAIREYAKLFYDLDAAKAFGAEVDLISTSEEVRISTGNNAKKISIFVDKLVYPEAEAIGVYHIIEKDKGTSDIYYVRYTAQSPRGSSRADFELARRHAEDYLNIKYQELGPDLGISRL
jgi:hypothetical protein